MVGFVGREELDIELDKEEEKEIGQSDLRLRNVIVRVCLGSGVGVRMSMVTARWSEIVRLVNSRLWTESEAEEQTRSRIWPCVCVGELTCCVRLRQFKMSKKSAVNLDLGQSMWMLKSPRTRMNGEMEES